ncbi:thiamine pyrophosphate-binding protein [Cellulosilyticum sp. I15G10I2]|uniref:thiamine pyrophosphate-binding protein n=1 Tax=Cellulosilyticum sp. I15G10I2 TaxID=1892843 RepID=UPI00085C302A|nr:thiamine pyrophosphate-binding protein [Cellulosilyticum sp. I15G10I2]
MKLSDYIAEFLIKNGCTHVFGYQGGAVTHLVDSLYKYKQIKFISTYHEQAAAFAAEGYARIKNSIGVAVATSGPGATNLITGVGSAYFDSVPCLYLTGQVNTYEYKNDLAIRQLGFQETDIVSIAMPITKYAVRITDPQSIRYELEKAVYTANVGRKGPVLLDIPMNIQCADVLEETLHGFEQKDCYDLDFDFETVIQYLNSSKRPVILVGGGVRISNASEVLNQVVSKLKIPVVSSLMGRDTVDNNHENYIGMIGAYGNRSANFTIANSDLIIALGTRLDTRQTGTKPENFARGAKLIRVDIDPGELDKKIKHDEVSIKAELRVFVEKLYESIERICISRGKWLEKTKEYKRKYPTFLQENFKDPNYVMAYISKSLRPSDIICLDVGQNQMWAAQSLCLKNGQRLLTSGGMGAMGFSLPCAIGAYYSGVCGSVFAFAGDGGIQMNIQELALIKRNRIPIKIIIMNNESLGMIRHFQEMYFEGRYCATVTDYEVPDFCKLANAYGIKSARLEKSNDFDTLEEILHNNEPMVIEIVLPKKTYVYPKLALNRPIEEQEPLLSREEFLENMIIEPAYNEIGIEK